MGPVTPNAPFSMSPDAALWLVEQLRAADRRPESSGMVPALFYALNSTTGDGKGGILEHIPYPHFHIGFLQPEQADAHEGVWIDVFDRRIFVHHSTLEELRGKYLTLHDVQSALGSHVLRAGAGEKGIFKFMDD